MSTWHQTEWPAPAAGWPRERRAGAPLTARTKASPLNSLAFGLCFLFVFAIPWENAILLPGVGTVSRLLGLMALPLGVLAILASGRVRRLSTPLVLMGLFVAYGCLSYLWTIDTEATGIVVFSWFQNLGMIWLVWELADSRERQLALMAAYVLGTLVSASDTLFSFLRGQEAHYQRYAGSGLDPNELGLLLALSLPMSFYLATTQRQKSVALIYRLQQVMAIVAIGLTGSRGAMIATVVALVYIPLSSVRITFREKCAFVLLAVIAGGCMFTLMPESSWRRWGGIGNELEQGSWGARKLIWSVGLEVFQEYPIQGVGTGSFSIAAQRLLARPEVAHNTFLSILVEEGLLGFGLFLLLLLSLVYPTLRLPVLERNLWLVALATWAAGVLALTWEGRKPTWFLFGMLAAWLASRNGTEQRPALAHAELSPARQAFACVRGE